MIRYDETRFFRRKIALSLICRISVDQIERTVLYALDKLVNLLRRVLKIVIHCDDERSPRITQTTHQCIVLPEVSHQIDHY